MSFYSMAIMGLAPFGSLLSGTLAKLIGTPLAILAGGLTCFAGALVFYFKLPLLKNLVRPVYAKMDVIPEIASGLQTASDPGATESK